MHAEDNGGSVRAWLPAFAPGTLGTEQLCSERDGKVFREEVGELHELPERTGTLFGMHTGRPVRGLSKLPKPRQRNRIPIADRALPSSKVPRLAEATRCLSRRPLQSTTEQSFS